MCHYLENSLFPFALSLSKGERSYLSRSGFDKPVLRLTEGAPPFVKGDIGGFNYVSF